MEINNNNYDIKSVGYINKTTESIQQETAKNTPTAGQSFSGDKVELSEQAREANQAFTQLKELPEIRNEKVGEVQNQVETGTYQVNGEKIAVSMLNESLENNAIMNAIDLEV